MKLILLLGVISIGTVSCHHVYYAPNTPNAPQLSEKGETRVNALYASGGDSEYKGGELQFAHAVTSKVGIMVNGFTAGKSETITDISGSNSHMEKGSGGYLEFAGGLFTTLDPKKKWVADIYGGFGFASIKNDYGFGDRAHTGFNKFFVQPSIGYKSRNFEFALVPRVSFVSWKVKTATINSTESQDARDEINALKGDPSFVAFEPALMARAGGENVKFQAGLAFSSFRASGYFIDYELGETLNASIGISVNLKPGKKNK